MSRIGLGRHGLIDEKAGDPLDGLVNLFDIGMILAVAFLIAGLTISVNPLSARHQRVAERARARVVSAPAKASKAHGRGHPVGTAYRLADGRLVIVAPR